MDQETHDVAVLLTRLVAWKDANAGREETAIFPKSDPRMPEFYAIVDAARALVSPPAKPEAKLEALPTMETVREWAVAVNNHMDCSCDKADAIAGFLDAIADGGLKIVDERGKGAEAERLAPCPVNGCGKTPVWRECSGSGMGDYNCPTHRYSTGQGYSCVIAGTYPEAEARRLWNAAFQRAERFPGER